eukprot:1137847-Pelagomonas_calceolata.AAC.2
MHENEASKAYYRLKLGLDAALLDAALLPLGLRGMQLWSMQANTSTAKMPRWHKTRGLKQHSLQLHCPRDFIPTAKGCNQDVHGGTSLRAIGTNMRQANVQYVEQPRP